MPVIAVEFHHYFLIPGLVLPIDIVWPNHFFSLIVCMLDLYICLLRMVFYPLHGFDGLFFLRSIPLQSYNADRFSLYEQFSKHQIADRNNRNTVSKRIDTYLAIFDVIS